MDTVTHDLSCPRCGSDDTRRRPGLLVTGRVCLACRKRYSPKVGGIVVALLFALPGLLFSLVAVMIGHFLIESNPGNAGNTQFGLLCGGIFAIPAFVFFALAIRELCGRRKPAPTTALREERDESLEELEHDVPVQLPRLLPREIAEAIVRRLAEKYGLRGVVRKLGNFRASHLANAVKKFADQMGDDETPLTFVDRSFLSNGKAGFLVTNRGLYSSQLRHVLWLRDIHVVSYAPPDFIASLLPVPSLDKQYRLFVNGKRAYAGQAFLAPDFWLDLLTALGEAAREKPLPLLELEADAASTDFFRPDAARRPKSVVLATVHTSSDGQPLEVRRFTDPTTDQIEQAIRDLDQRDRPSLRLLAGEGVAAILEIRGGNGTYTLRQPGDGWVYYDPTAGDEQVEVCAGERCPAFHVCTDVNEVLRIARRFVETGAFE